MKKLALFDFDKTIISVDSIVSFKDFCLKEGFNITNFDKSTLPFNISSELQNLLNKQSWLRGLEGMSRNQFGELSHKFVKEVLLHCIIEKVINSFKQLQDDNYNMIVISASYNEFIKTFLNLIGIIDVQIISNEILFENSCLKPEFTSLNCSGINKLILLNKNLNLRDYDLNESYGYTDHISDISFLSLVGNKFVVKNQKTKDDWSTLYDVNYIYY